VVNIPRHDIRAGHFEHVGLRYEAEKLQCPPGFVPPPTAGRFSQRNTRGWTEVHRDCPKVLKSWTIETPNWGDWSKGSHDIVFTKEVYQRTFHPPRVVAILVEHIGEDPIAGAEIVRFAVDEPLSRKNPNFYSQLLFDLNILQENIGICDLYESDETIDTYLRSLYVNWEILPPGESEETINRIIGIVGDSDPVTRAIIADRYAVLASLQPRHLITGQSGFARYFGAQFADDLVVFENLRYGNAIYIMFDDWQVLSQKSRIELLESREEYKRIVHRGNWKRRLISEVKRKLEERNHP